MELDLFRLFGKTINSIEVENDDYEDENGNLIEQKILTLLTEDGVRLSVYIDCESEIHIVDEEPEPFGL